MQSFWQSSLLLCAVFSAVNAQGTPSVRLLVVLLCSRFFLQIVAEDTSVKCLVHCNLNQSGWMNFLPKYLFSAVYFLCIPPIFWFLFCFFLSPCKVYWDAAATVANFGYAGPPHSRRFSF